MPRRNRRRSLQDLLQLARTKGPKGMFNHTMVQLAEALNKQGLRRQLEFLLKYLGKGQLTTTLRDLLEREGRISQLTNKAVSGDRLGLLVRVVYDLKMKEAHHIAHANPRTIVRYLVNQLGEDKTERLVTSE